MRAIITAAGRGRRLRPLTDDKPKSLVVLGDKTIIEHTLDRFDECGIREVVLVIGFEAQKVRDHLGERYKRLKIIYEENKEYATTDNMVSLWLAKDHIDEGFIFVNADVIFHREILTRLLDNPHPDVCVIKEYDDIPKDAMKLHIVDDRIAAIGRRITNGNARAIGMYKYSPEGAKLYFEKMDELMHSDREMLQIEQPLEMFLEEREMHVLRTKDIPWEEIDDESDLKNALTMLDKITDVHE